MLAANRLVGWVRRRLGISYWSLAAWTKRSVKNAVKVIGTYEAALVAEARRSDVDGIICGHIHHAEIRQLNGCCYVNTGDWVESGTAVLEHHDGRLELVHWAAIESSPSAPGPDHSGLAASDDLADRGLVAAFLAFTGDAP
jgi:UDP-2,3-diacylglucosamine pyrophosphatase LpxH